MAQPEKHIDIWIKQLLETGSFNERLNMYFVVEDSNEEKITVACDSKLFETIVYAFQDALSNMYRLFPEPPEETGEPIQISLWEAERVLAGYMAGDDRIVLNFETRQKVPVHVALEAKHLEQLQSSLRQAIRAKQKSKNRKPH